LFFKIETIVGAFIVAAIGLFLAMIMQLSSVRLDLARYATYTANFKDVSGLSEKADIKIAGVKVGWVDSVYLVPQDFQVKVTLKILKEYRLHADARAFVRQEGLLGAKFLEVVQGSSSEPLIPHGGTFAYQMRQFVGLDEIFYIFQKLGSQIEQLSASVKHTSDEAADLLNSLKNSMKKVDTLLEAASKATESGHKSFESTADALKDVAAKVTHFIEKAQEPVEHVGALAQKLTEGQGSLGKILQDGSLYEDVRGTAEYAKTCVERIKKWSLNFDSHFEVLPHADKKTNLKWYANAYILPGSQYFLKTGLVYDQRGFAKHLKERFDHQDLCIVKERKDSFRLNLQAGRIFNSQYAVRLGIFQGTVGVGFDAWLPFKSIDWLTTFEAFDFRGHNRFCCDRRPHLRWLNRLFLNNHVYLAFGADDFISKYNKSGFVGMGAAFSLPELKRPCLS
jgi:phospholipid/cholesterol/gamma-HCH transport system substrate-binding protein